MSRATVQSYGRYFRGIALTFAAALLVGTAGAQDAVEREGYFEVRSASTRLINGVHSLDARLQLVLSSEALNALNSGVPLTIELQLQVIRLRRFYLDSVDAELAGKAAKPADLVQLCSPRRAEVREYVHHVVVPFVVVAVLIVAVTVARSVKPRRLHPMQHRSVLQDGEIERPTVVGDQTGLGPLEELKEGL